MLQTDQHATTAGHFCLDAGERRRLQKMGDIADWYRNQVSHDEFKRPGTEISLMADYDHRIILVSSFTRGSNPFTHMAPPASRMQFDADVLRAIHDGLQSKDHMVIVDTSDISGYGGDGDHGAPHMNARITTVDINAGEVIGEPLTITKSKPELPPALRNSLLSVPRTTTSSEQVNYVAERFFHKFLTSCVAA